jgi:hypothetical protein
MKNGSPEQEKTGSLVDSVFNFRYSKVGYCNCGYEIWIEFLPSGFKWIYRFFDMDHNEITECPACGNKITEEELVLK